MSRVAKTPIVIPADVKININGQDIFIKGKNGELVHSINEAVSVHCTNNKLDFLPKKGYNNGWALAGTTRALLKNMVIGVTSGFIKKLQLVGIGYRVVLKNNILTFSLGFSHLISHQLPAGVIAECPSQTEIILKSADKQVVGQVAADLRSYRRPDPYKGKGIRYFDEVVRIKETKKK